jgi:hypothetical protein
MTDTTTGREYGIRHINGDTVWPDSDGDLYLGSRYYHADERNSAERGPVDVEELRSVLPAGAVLTSRVWTAVEEIVPVPLPTTRGSLIRATRSGIPGTALCDGTSTYGWVFLPDGLDGQQWVAARELTLVEVLYEPS